MCGAAWGQEGVSHDCGEDRTIHFGHFNPLANMIHCDCDCTWNRNGATRNSPDGDVPLSDADYRDLKVLVLLWINPTMALGQEHMHECLGAELLAAPFAPTRRHPNPAPQTLVRALRAYRTLWIRNEELKKALGFMDKNASLGQRRFEGMKWFW